MNGPRKVYGSRSRKRAPVDPATLCAEGRRLLWDAINRYARACGGDPSACSYPSRKPAIADIECMLQGTPYERPREPTTEAADAPKGS